MTAAARQAAATTERGAARRYHCPACGMEAPLHPPLARCGCGKSHVNLTPGGGLGIDEIVTADRSLWRWRKALPLGQEPAVTLGEGGTPMVAARWAGSDVRMKLDYVNPSGSFKDRGMAVMLDYLRRAGIDAVTEDSSGNGGAALATYAARAGMRCRIYVPEATSRGKVVQIGAAGAEVVRIAGSREAVARAAMADASGAFYASHNNQPFFLEGTKTLGYEIWDDLGRAAPDAVVAPLGGGSMVLGIAAAFDELKRRGLVERGPRIYGVQAAACAPVHAAFVAGAASVAPVTPRPTLAEGITLADPVRGREVLAALRASGGGTVAVEEDAIASALSTLARAGFYVEPTSAAAGAGLSALLADGRIAHGEATVLVLSGSGLKASERIAEILAKSAQGD